MLTNFITHENKITTAHLIPVIVEEGGDQILVWHIIIKRVIKILNLFQDYNHNNYYVVASIKLGSS